MQSPFDIGPVLLLYIQGPSKCLPQILSIPDYCYRYQLLTDIEGHEGNAIYPLISAQLSYYSGHI